MKTNVVGTHLKCLTEALQMSTCNICFCGEIRKIFSWCLLVSGTMLMTWNSQYYIDIWWVSHRFANIYILNTLTNLHSVINCQMNMLNHTWNIFISLKCFRIFPKWYSWVHSKAIHPSIHPSILGGRMVCHCEETFWKGLMVDFCRSGSCFTWSKFRGWGLFISSTHSSYISVFLREMDWKIVDRAIKPLLGVSIHPSINSAPASPM